MISSELILVVTGFIAGAIDSIAGGGGLITLPVLSEVLSPGANAIGTNKIIGTAGALIAFLVYLKKQKLQLKKSVGFILAVGLGSLLGSILNPMVPKIYFRYFLVFACPGILWVLWNKQLLIQEVKEHASRPLSILIMTGVGVGFYDGFFGPGGGTFMLIGLLWGVRLPLFEALLLSKLANTLSASIALVSYGIQGFVHVRIGLIMGIGVVLGGYLGARLASNRAEKAVRPVLTLVVLLLMAIQLKEVLNYH